MQRLNYNILKTPYIPTIIHKLFKRLKVYIPLFSE